MSYDDQRLLPLLVEGVTPPPPLTRSPMGRDVTDRKKKRKDHHKDVTKVQRKDTFEKKNPENLTSTPLHNYGQFFYPNVGERK